MYVRDARAQVAKAPQPVGHHQQGYPSPFHNREKLPVQASAPLQHIPLIPGQKTTYTKQKGQGAWRAFFNNNNRQIFDVRYHNPNAGKTPNGSDQFTLGHYYPQKVGSEADADEQTVEDDNSETEDDDEDLKSTEDRSTSDL